MGSAGGRVVSEKLQSLRDALEDYFGAITALENGQQVSIPEQPEALTYYHSSTKMHIPLVEGGVMDQPHIWLMEYAICEQRTELQTILNNRSSESRKSPPIEDDNLDIKFAQDQ